MPWSSQFPTTGQMKTDYRNSGKHWTVFCTKSSPHCKKDKIYNSIHSWKHIYDGISILDRATFEWKIYVGIYLCQSVNLELQAIIKPSLFDPFWCRLFPLWNPSKRQWHRSWQGRSVLPWIPKTRGGWGFLPFMLPVHPIVPLAELRGGAVSPEHTKVHPLSYATASSAQRPGNKKKKKNKTVYLTIFSRHVSGCTLTRKKERKKNHKRWWWICDAVPGYTSQTVIGIKGAWVKGWNIFFRCHFAETLMWNERWKCQMRIYCLYIWDSPSDFCVNCTEQAQNFTRIYRNVSDFTPQILLLQKGGLEANCDKSLVARGF